MKNKKIITICSSAAFYNSVLEIEKELKKLNFKILIPSTARKMQKTGNFNVDHYKTWYKNENDYHKKKKLMDEHFKKVIESDGILVINMGKNGISGYIGGNVLMEMVVAYQQKIPIFIWNNIDENSPFEEEIKGMGSIFINQNLTKINIKE